MKTLPPKRFQDPADPLYDPIRFEPWFAKLMVRRAKNCLLKGAMEDVALGLWTQKVIADRWGVDPRELRDYANWVAKTPRKAVSVDAQAILDGAYFMYCRPKDGFHTELGCSIQHYIRHVASLFGVKARPIEELWETHPNFLPTGYPLSVR